MAKARILAPWVGKENKSAVYNCVSRVVERQFHFGDAEKEAFVQLMRIYEEFCGVKVLSFCVMSNHFHILVDIPPRPEGGISDDEILDRLSLVQKPGSVEIVRELFKSYQSEDVTDLGRLEHEALREKYLARMWDLGKFMKYLKQQFSRWFNKKHDRKGTLWEERYSSALVEGGYPALIVSAYIDLNPVRAGIVEDPKDYRWSSYAQAVAGGDLARAGIGSVFYQKDAGMPTEGEFSEEVGSSSFDWQSIAGRYRVFLFEEGHAPGDSLQAKSIQGAKNSRRKGFTSEQIASEKERGGELSLAAKLHCKTRSLIDGAVIGSRGFVEGVISQLNAQDFWKNPRKTGGKKLNFSAEKSAKSRRSRGKNKRQTIEAESSCSNTVVEQSMTESEELWSLRRLKNE